MTQAHEVRLVAYCDALSRAGWISLKDLPVYVILMPPKPTDGVDP